MSYRNALEYCMKIPNISKLETIRSPDLSIHGIPWRIIVKKLKRDNYHSLGAFLQCSNKDKSSEWSISGAASFKLLSFGDDEIQTEYHTPPLVFDASLSGYGMLFEMIKWKDLFNEAKRYIENDTIKLKIKIWAENPNDTIRSRLNFESIQKSFLKVVNVLNLIAVQSPRFKLGKLTWVIQV